MIIVMFEKKKYYDGMLKSFQVLNFKTLPSTSQNISKAVLLPLQGQWTRWLSYIQRTSHTQLPVQLIPMSGVISGVMRPQDKTKSNPVTREKARIFSKSGVNFYSIPVSLKRGSFHSQKATSIKRWKQNKQGLQISKLNR